MKILCDRCGHVVEGFTAWGFTSGFFNMRNGSWAKYNQGNERFVCAPCMNKDPKYCKDHGRIPSG